MYTLGARKREKETLSALLGCVYVQYVRLIDSGSSIWVATRNKKNIILNFIYFHFSWPHIEHWTHRMVMYRQNENRLLLFIRQIVFVSVVILPIRLIYGSRSLHCW